jgi:3-oxoacyl-[acyl-carrier protein] reductase
MTRPPQYPDAAALTFDEIEVGQVFELDRTFSQEDTLAFAAVSGDYSPLHVDVAYAADTEFGTCVVHGILLASLFSQLVGMRVPGRHALYLGQDLTFRRPVLVGERVRALAKVTGKSDATRSIVLATEIRSADGKVAVAGTARVKVRDVAPATRQMPAAHSVVAAGVDPKRRVALVSGGSRGIGAAIAGKLASRNIAVAVNYFRSPDRAAAVVRDIQASGGEAYAVQADVRDPTAVARMVNEVGLRLGPPTILVNAAVGELAQRPFQELTWADFEAQMDYQLKAVINLCQALYPAMRELATGTIVNLASQVVAGTPPGLIADYVAAKHALVGLSKALAAEWASDGIRVNIVSPGLTRTELTQFHQERVFKMEAARTPLHRLATVEDIAQAVAYLATDDSSFLTGTNLFVTGGQVML